MKTLFRTLFTALALVFFVQNASASHNAGGDLHYEYVSSTGNSHKYKIYMRLYRDIRALRCPRAQPFTLVQQTTQRSAQR